MSSSTWLCWCMQRCGNALAVQVWKNCRSFNAEGSEIAHACTDAAKWIRRLWSQLGLPKKEKPMQQPAKEADSQPGPGPSSKNSRRADKAALNGALESAEPEHEAVREAALGIRKRKRRALEGEGDADVGQDLPRNKKVRTSRRLGSRLL